MNTARNARKAHSFKKSISTLIAEIHKGLAVDGIWSAFLYDATRGKRSIHLGIFVEPYLTYVLEGTKTVESRFSVNRCAPWNRVESGDLLFLKRSGGPVIGVCSIGQVWSYRLEANTFNELRTEFSESLRAQDPAFWTSRAKASYATLMRVENVRRLPSIDYPKQDRRGWVVLLPRLDLPLT